MCALPDLTAAAFFFDFDGTLVEIAAHPNAILLELGTLNAVRRLHCATDGAVAVVTGRDIEMIDHFFQPLKLPVAGVHGLTRRDSKGFVYSAAQATQFIDSAQSVMLPFALNEEGLVVERKSASIALHYRARPDLESICIKLMETVARDFPNIEIKRGKMVVEAKPNHADKGTAIRDFMSEAPFKGRHPIFAGDDETDEDAFEVVNALGGVTIKIGDGPTCAQRRMATTAAFTAWLVDLATKQQERNDA